MSDIGNPAINSSMPSSSSTNSPLSTDTNVQQVGSAATGAATAEGESGSDTTTFKSLGDFQKKYPVIYDKMMQGIMTNIINDMKHSQERLEEMWRKSREH